MCQECVSSLPEATSTLCIMRDTVCMCFPFLLPPTLLRPADVHSPLFYLVGGAGIHVSRLRPILARGSIHPVYHEEHCVCVCVYVCVCVCVCLPSPAHPNPTAFSRCS